MNSKTSFRDKKTGQKTPKGLYQEYASTGRRKAKDQESMKKIENLSREKQTLKSYLATSRKESFSSNLQLKKIKADKLNKKLPRSMRSNKKIQNRRNNENKKSTRLKNTRNSNKINSQNDSKEIQKAPILFVNIVLTDNRESKIPIYEDVDIALSAMKFCLQFGIEDVALIEVLKRRIQRDLDRTLRKKKSVETLKEIDKKEDEIKIMKFDKCPPPISKRRGSGGDLKEKKNSISKPLLGEKTSRGKMAALFNRAESDLKSIKRHLSNQRKSPKGILFRNLNDSHIPVYLNNTEIPQRRRGANRSKSNKRSKVEELALKYLKESTRKKKDPDLVNSMKSRSKSKLSELKNKKKSMNLRSLKERFRNRIFSTQNQVKIERIDVSKNEKRPSNDTQVSEKFEKMKQKREDLFSKLKKRLKSRTRKSSNSVEKDRIANKVIDFEKIRDMSKSRDHISHRKRRKASDVISKQEEPSKNISIKDIYESIKSSQIIEKKLENKRSKEEMIKSNSIIVKETYEAKDQSNINTNNLMFYSQPEQKNNDKNSEVNPYVEEDNLMNYTESPSNQKNSSDRDESIETLTPFGEKANEYSGKNENVENYVLKKIFQLMDSQGNGYISPDNLNFDNIPTEMLEILELVLFEVYKSPKFTSFPDFLKFVYEYKLSTRLKKVIIL